MDSAMQRLWLVSVITLSTCVSGVCKSQDYDLALLATVAVLQNRNLRMLTKSWTSISDKEWPKVGL